MTDAQVIDLAAATLMVATKIAAPILLVSLAVGTFISLIQAVTQVQEMTLTFVPKLAGIALTIVIAGSWMLHELTTFARGLLTSIPSLVG